MLRPYTLWARAWLDHCPSYSCCTSSVMVPTFSIQHAGSFMSFQKPATPASVIVSCHFAHHCRTRALVKSGKTHSPGQTLLVNQLPSGFRQNIPCSFPSLQTG